MKSPAPLLWPLISIVASLAASASSSSPPSSSLSLEDLNHALNAQHTTNQSLLWGTYRPNLYFGLRTRSPVSFLTGLLWYGVGDYRNFGNLRHECSHDNNIGVYTWAEHDGRTWGRQVLEDTGTNWRIETEHIKFPGGEHGGSWAVRIRGSPLSATRLARAAFTFYAGLEGLGTLKLEGELHREGLSQASLIGDSPELGEFTLRIIDRSIGPSLRATKSANDFEKDFSKLQYWGASVPLGQLWQIKDILSRAIAEGFNPILKKYGQENLPDPALVLSLPNEISEGSNTFAFQKLAEQNPFELLILFENKEVPALMTEETISNSLRASSDAFQNRFEEIFGLARKGFNIEENQFAKEQLSNMMGGIGYFYGQSIVDRSSVDDIDEEDEGFWERIAQRAPKPTLTDPSSLFTTTPSRSFFPRGFYWDEGFHQLLVGEWDNDLSLEMIQDWTKHIDEDGWIAREQILGEEARSRVPSQFQTQYPNHANPPTLIMAVAAYLKRLERNRDPLGSMENIQHAFEVSSDHTASANPTVLAMRHLKDPILARHFLQQTYDKFRLNWQWFRRTQRGQLREYDRKPRSKTEAYKWRGRTPDHCLTSGLDDYPRAQPPHPGELHLDLISWMGFYTEQLQRMAEYLDLSDDIDEYKRVKQGILMNLDDLHWSEEHKAFCDATVDEYDETIHVCHKGYVSILPAILGLLPPDSPKLGAILEMIQAPEHLWSPYGVRSLSKSDPFFGKDENYWRGPVWTPLNYLVLQSMHEKYMRISGPYQKQAENLYKELRANLIKNTYQVWKDTHFVWEQYDSETGKGLKSHPFTGWTALIVLIMAEKY